MCIMCLCLSESKRLSACVLCDRVHVHVLCVWMSAYLPVCARVSRRLRGIAWVCMRECGGRALL